MIVRKKKKKRVKFKLKDPRITFPADVVAGREQDRSQPEHQFTQEARLRVLEDLHPFQSV